MLNQHWVEFLFDRFVRLFAAMRFTRDSAPAIGLFVFIVAVGAVNYAPQYDGAVDAASLPELAEPASSSAGAGAPHGGGVHGSAGGLAVRSVPSLSNEQQNIARFIARRYQLAIEQTQEFVEYAYRTAREAKLDPWLILAVISVESSFDPEAQSHRGAQGLMQVLTRVHADKFAPFGGVSAAFDPLANIKVGAQILKSYLVRDGSVEGALKAYAGAALLPHDGGYGAKVLTERERIAAAAGGRPDAARTAQATPAKRDPASVAAAQRTAERSESARSPGSDRQSPDAVFVAPVELSPPRLEDRASLEPASARSREL